MDSKTRDDRHTGSRNCYASSEVVPDIVFDIAEDAAGVPFHAATLKFWTDGIFGWLDVKDGEQSVVSVGIHIADGQLRVGIYGANDQPIYEHVVDG